MEHAYCSSAQQSDHKQRKKTAVNKEAQFSAKFWHFHKYQGEHKIDHIGGNAYTDYSVPGNRNYFFFNCPSLAFQGDFSNAGYYRNIIYQKIIHEWDNWKYLAFISHDLRVNSVIHYWQSMINSNGWATNCEIKMFSKGYPLEAKAAPKN